MGGVEPHSDDARVGGDSGRAALGESEIVRAHQEGIEGALAKPVDANELARVVERYAECQDGTTDRQGAAARRP